MRQDRHVNNRGKDFLEDFRALLKSDLWQCLPQKTREEILVLLAEYREDYAEQKH